MTLKQLLAHPAVKTITVGSCIEGKPLSQTAKWTTKAHAHISGKHTGCICIRSPRDVLKPNSRQVSHLVLHELAHLISKQGHTDGWRAAMVELGQPVPVRYGRHG